MNNVFACLLHKRKTLLYRNQRLTQKTGDSFISELDGQLAGQLFVIQ